MGIPFDFERKQYLKQVKDFAASDPLLATDIIKAAVDGMKDYEKQISELRSSQGRQAIEFTVNFLYDAKMKKKDPRFWAILCVDAFVTLFPKGPHSAVGCGGHTKEFFKDFVRIYHAQEDLYGSDWEENAKGHREYFKKLYDGEWWDATKKLMEEQ